MDIKVEEMSVVKVEEDKFMDIKEEEVPVVKFEELTAINIKEEIPWDVTSPTVKAEEDQVSYMCVCPLLDTFYKYHIMPTIFYDQHCLCLFVGLATSNHATVMSGNAYTFVRLFETVAGTVCACTSREQEIEVDYLISRQ